MKLEKITPVEGSLRELLEKADHGEKILMLEGVFDGWDMFWDEDELYHSALGIVYHGGEKMAENTTSEWLAYKKGVLFLEEKKITDGKTGEIVFEGDYHQAIRYKDTFLVQTGGKLLVGGKGSPIYQDLEYAYFKVRPHPSGFVAIKHGYGRRVEALLNGSREIFNGMTSKTDWEPHESGIVTYRDHTFFLNDGRPIISDWHSGWTSNKSGIVIQQGDKIYLVVVKLPGY